MGWIHDQTLQVFIQIDREPFPEVCLDVRHPVVKDRAILHQLQVRSSGQKGTMTDAHPFWLTPPASTSMMKSTNSWP